MRLSRLDVYNPLLLDISPVSVSFLKTIPIVLYNVKCRPEVGGELTPDIPVFHLEICLILTEYIKFAALTLEHCQQAK